MKILNLDEITEGMVVGRPIEVDGRVMLGTGTILTEKMLKLLKTWGVAKISISDNGDGQHEEILSDITLSQYEERMIKSTIDRRFSFCNKPHEVLTEIKRIARKRETSKIKQQKANNE